MGCLRLLLAMIVVVSHLGIPVLGYNPGVVAVITFFLLSGYVMTILIQRHYASVDRIKDFYLDRAARLFPQFLVYMIATLALISLTAANSSYLGGCTSYKVGLNFLILPLDFYKFLDLGNCSLIPPAWSLGLELSFYLVAPILILFYGAARLAAVASVGIFLLAYFGLIDTDTYGYRLLPGTLFVFLVGSAFAQPKSLGRYYPWAILIFSAALLEIAYLDRTFLVLSYNKEVLAGLIIGIPTLAIIRIIPFSGVDEFLGNLSYGVFLNHYLCIWFMQSVMCIEINRIRHWLLLFMISISLSLANCYGVELPALRWRRNLRNRPTPHSL